ncbi:MAG: Holliday junction resolvase RuvX [Clostridiales bacterium]|jgi:putative Holliday junction resolvase|nr:Holliday junction resolvase RuvX [Clostridiales bacterium]
MRIMAVDYGDARVGLAVCDPLGILSSPLCTLNVSSMREAIDKTAQKARDENAELIVVGLPVNMDGTEGERCQKTRAFGRNLQKVTALPVEYEDERLTSVSAGELLTEAGVKKDRQKSKLDAVAAQIILQSYIDRTKN